MESLERMLGVVQGIDGRYAVFLATDYLVGGW